jgi:hypothetical protein
VQSGISGSERDAKCNAITPAIIDEWARGLFFGPRFFFHHKYKEERKMLGTVLIVVLILALLGALPRWSHSREWGYAPTGGLGLVLLVVVILLVLGRI